MTGYPPIRRLVLSLPRHDSSKLPIRWTRFPTLTEVDPPRPLLLPRVLLVSTQHDYRAALQQSVGQSGRCGVQIPHEAPAQTVLPVHGRALRSDRVGRPECSVPSCQGTLGYPPSSLLGPTCRQLHATPRRCRVENERLYLCLCKRVECGVVFAGYLLRRLCIVRIRRRGP